MKWFFSVFVNESVNNEIPEKKVCLGVYTPKHTFFSGVHTTVDQNRFSSKLYEPLLRKSHFLEKHLYNTDVVLTKFQ